MTPQLNWKELEIYLSKIRPLIEGLFIERIVIPKREEFPDGYLKGEWNIRFTGKENEGCLFISIRHQHPYLCWNQGKGPKASTHATHTVFDLSLTKYLKGARLLEVESIPKERIAIFWFTQTQGELTDPEGRLGLVLVLIPHCPEALLVSTSKSIRATPDQTSGWPVLVRSREVHKKDRDNKNSKSYYFPPDGQNAPPNPKVRNELLEAPDSYSSLLKKGLLSEAFAARLQSTERHLKQLLKQVEERLRQSKTALKEAHREPHWQKWGDLLKATLHFQTVAPTEGDDFQNLKQVPHSGVTERTAMDFEFGDLVQIPCDPKLNLKQQIDKFYQNSKRKQRRVSEATSRISLLQEKHSELERCLTEKPTLLDWDSLARWEQAGGTGPSTQQAVSSPSKKDKAAWLGKSFVSKSGLVIWAGRNRDENLELTFKHARGNDLWMHVRGRPGAHVVIPVQPGKSIPLETLLDAAMITIHYSGGQNWGKTEVDYTFKKHVKRIKNSKEVSYTHNKTLIVEPNPDRLKVLLSQS